jgi:hypothetical protein
VIIIRKQTHQRVRTVAHSQKLPTRVRSCRSRHASRCIPSTSMRRVDSGVTPARRRRRRPDPPLKLHLRVSFLFFCRYVGSRALARAVVTILVQQNGDGEQALVVAVVNARPDVRPGFRATYRNQARLSQFLGPKERRPLDAEPSPTAGRRFFLADCWTQSHSDRYVRWRAGQRK